VVQTEELVDWQRPVDSWIFSGKLRTPHEFAGNLLKASHQITSEFL
jgi:hypothetical protein